MYRFIKSNFFDKKNQATLIYILAAIYPFAVNLILIPVYFSMFGNPEKEYAIISIISITQSYLVASVMIGLDMSFVKFFLDVHKNEKESKEVSQSFLGTLIISIIVNFFIYYFFSKWIFNYFWSDSIDFSKFQWLIFASAIFTVMNQSTFQYFRVQEQPIKALMSIVIPFTFFGIGGILFMGLFDNSAFSCILGRTIMLGLASVPFFLYLIFKNGISTQLNRKLLSYAIITFLGVFIEIISGSIDKITITKTFHLELETFGVYSLAFLYVTSVGFLITGYINAQTPSLFKALAIPESDETKKIVLKFTYTLIVLSCVINTTIFLFADLVSLILTESNRMIFIKFVLLLIPLNLLRLFGAQYNTAIYYYSKTIWFSISTVAYIGTFLVLNFVVFDSISIIYLPVLVVCSTIPSILIMRYIFNKYAEYYMEEKKAFLLVLLFLVVIFLKYVFGIYIENIFISMAINLFLIITFLLLGYWLLRKEINLIFVGTSYVK